MFPNCRLLPQQQACVLLGPITLKEFVLSPAHGGRLCWALHTVGGCAGPYTQWELVLGPAHSGSLCWALHTVGACAGPSM